ncbi:hypothetical protein GE21DRAFT_5398 [Neurospora crassa]|uniref:RBR-type E3 ubiquitin transferase n=1 Tax=Neurospora crassa (strain ATCC 24698 / 74-OR23-1A / CBS 708.71 / DSM 1257 / FGSC 987) TaxID=367110 RepID=Q7S3S6_NEUCR|nr:hypothetical protein NCU04941 [Neurospora crassa OR74A]EAA30153.2 hypothetical protein NCU04941 [Neurospora crassa OR74A]KHE81600.1 hypothetical protein GE21DRAFT_5398 [Neurospora crassa]|eukprot:XP_959389.2 hypothetical protein NCU04941 [Neurospora crassa OR74A]
MRRSSKGGIKSTTLKDPTDQLSTSFYTKNNMVVTSTTVEPLKSHRNSECVVCMDEFPADQLIYFCPPSPSDDSSNSNPSNHGYCGGCLVEGIRSAMKGRYPFRCCGKIFDTKDYQGASLSADEKQAYEDMVEELTTSDPLYCSNRQCGSFIKPALIKSDLGLCPKCFASTCKHCRQASHPRLVCKQDQDTLKVLTLGKKRGWKLCPVCGYMVELVKGCHIIKCKCDASFCYRCGASNVSDVDDRRHMWHPSCWRPEDYAIHVTPPRLEQPQRPRRGFIDMLGRLHVQWRSLDREWRLELERDKLRRREWPRELEMEEELETLENTALRAPNPLQFAAKNNSNNINHYQQARARPQQNAQPHQQPRQEHHNPLINREHERGLPWQPLMVAPHRPVFYQPQANPWPNQLPEPQGQRQRRS